MKNKILKTLEQAEKSICQLDEVMVDCINHIDNSIFKFLDKSIAMFFNDEVIEWCTVNMWFQENHLHIKVIEDKNETAFNVSKVSTWIRSWNEIEKMKYLDNAIKIAEKACAMFLDKSWKEVREQLIKKTDYLLYQDLYIYEKQ